MPNPDVDREIFRQMLESGRLCYWEAQAVLRAMENMPHTQTDPPGVREVDADNNGFVAKHCRRGHPLYDCTAATDIQRRYVCIPCKTAYVIYPPTRSDRPSAATDSADEIVRYLEARVPLLRAHTPNGWVDFRGGYGKGWRSGIRVRMKSDEFGFPTEVMDRDADPIQMQAAFDTYEDATMAAKELQELGIAATVDSNGEVSFVRFFVGRDFARGGHGAPRCHE